VVAGATATAGVAGAAVRTRVPRAVLNFRFEF
jgi:hypothetical protein